MLRLDKKIKLEEVCGTHEQIATLYKLLEKRIHVISHQQLPTFEEHKNFVTTHPYVKWFIVKKKTEPVGSFYTKKDNSIGINILIQDKKLIRKIIEFIQTNLKPKTSSPSEVPPHFYINTPYSNIELQRILIESEATPIQISYRI